jgi:hypothetical protein
MRSFSSEDDAGTISLVRSLGQEIFSLMFQGAEDLLEPGTRLLFEQEVFLFPLELAFDGEQFVGHKYATDNWIRRTGDFEERPSFDWLPGQQARRGSECLFAGSEDHSVAGSFASALEWKTGQTTDANELLKRLRDENVAILHFSGHASYDEKHGENSYLWLLHDQNLNRVRCQDLERSWRQPPRLVFLNTCSAGGIKDDYKGLVDLASVFLRAGVTRCVTTSWSISDDAALAVAERFYDALLRGSDTAEALRLARLQCWANRRGMLTSLSYVLLSRFLTNPSISEKWLDVESTSTLPAHRRRRIFISYSHKDQQWADQLRRALRPLDVAISAWDDTTVKAGSWWRGELQAVLEGVDAVVILVSPSFFGSEFIAEKELPFVVNLCERRRVPMMYLCVKPVHNSLPELPRFEALNRPLYPLETLGPAELKKELDIAAKRIVESASISPP